MQVIRMLGESGLDQEGKKPLGCGYTGFLRER